MVESCDDDNNGSASSERLPSRCVLVLLEFAKDVLDRAKFS